MRRKNGRKNFYQWELNQRLIVEEACTMVQFANGTLPNALGVEVKEENGTRYAEVPNILLQTAADLRAYAWDEASTSVVGSTVFPVYPMEKPAQYAYTQTEVKQYDLLQEELQRLAQEVAENKATGEALLGLCSQGRSAKYYVYTPGWKRVLNIIRATNGTLSLGIAKARAGARSVQALGVDFTGYVNFPTVDVDAEPMIYQRYNHEFGHNLTDDISKHARITHVRVGYPVEGTDFPNTDGAANYATDNPINCYVDVYVEFEPQSEEDRVQLDINFAGFADSHNCEAILEETNAEDVGMYGEELTYKTFTVSKDATLYMPNGTIMAQNVFADNMPYEQLTGTTENPVVLYNLADGIYYLSGTAKLYPSATAKAYPVGIYFVRRYSSYVSVCMIQINTVHNMRWYKITSSNCTETLIELDNIATNTAMIEEKAVVDDTTVGADAWSSKNIVDKLCPAFTESGTAVTCEPMEGVPFNVICEGSACHHVGKNLIPQPYRTGDTSMNMVEFWVNTDYSITMSSEENEVTSVASFVLLGKGTGANAQDVYAIGVKPGETYTISTGNALPDGVSIVIFFYDLDGVAKSSTSINSGSSYKTFTVPSSTQYIYAYVRVSSGIYLSYTTIYPMLEKGGTATDYEPYKSEIYEGDTLYTVLPYPGVNTIFAEDWESLTVTGKKDPVALINKLEATVNALLGG